jgi:hypothetical protein
MESTQINETETVKTEVTKSDIASQPSDQMPNMKIPEVLNQNQALQVLVDAARVAQSKGIFTLDDAELVNKAIKAFIPTGPVASNG